MGHIPYPVSQDDPGFYYFCKNTIEFPVEAIDMLPPGYFAPVGDHLVPFHAVASNVLFGPTGGDPVFIAQAFSDLFRRTWFKTDEVGMFREAGIAEKITFVCGDKRINIMMIGLGYYIARQLLSFRRAVGGGQRGAS